jgi:hypothetical protein
MTTGTLDDCNWSYIVSRWHCHVAGAEVKHPHEVHKWLGWWMASRHFAVNEMNTIGGRKYRGSWLRQRRAYHAAQTSYGMLSCWTSLSYLMLQMAIISDGMTTIYTLQTSNGRPPKELSSYMHRTKHFMNYHAMEFDWKNNDVIIKNKH